jgi:hypothetical protein
MRNYQVKKQDLCNTDHVQIVHVLPCEKLEEKGERDWICDSEQGENPNYGSWGADTSDVKYKRKWQDNNTTPEHHKVKHFRTHTHIFCRSPRLNKHYTQKHYR